MGNMFGIDSSAAPAQPQEDNVMPVIATIIPATGWRAAFGTLNLREEARIDGLVCFALVDLVPLTVTDPPMLPQRVVRPMTTDYDGEIVDVEEDEDFICVIPPTISDVLTQHFVDDAKKRRIAEQAE
jgi:hypothetical protein